MKGSPQLEQGVYQGFDRPRAIFGPDDHFAGAVVKGVNRFIDDKGCPMMSPLIHSFNRD